MTKVRGLRALASVAVASAVVATGLVGAGFATAGVRTAASGSTYGAAISRIVNPSTKQGGTLRVTGIGDCDSWDPQRTYVGSCWVLQRLYTRSLLGFRGVPGQAGAVPVPDLATAMPKYSGGGKIVTVTLKSGLKYSNGKPITAQDIKYGIERLWAQDVIYGGPTQYFLCLLDTCKTPGKPQYGGPYKDKKNQPKLGGKPSITVKGNTLTFHMSQIFSDFNYLLALPTTAPVPVAYDKAGTYSQHVVSSGPFYFATYVQNVKVVWKRNPYWKQSSDKIRHPLAKEVDLNFNDNADTSDQSILNGNVDYAVDGGVQNAALAKVVTDPNKGSSTSQYNYSDDATTVFTRYFAVMPSVAPLGNIHCRRAIFYALNKAALRKIRGGTYGGQLTGTLMNPQVPGANPNYNPYPSGAGSTGNIPKAKQELAACGKPGGFTTKLAYVPTGRGPLTFAAVQSALGKVGIKVNAAAGPTDGSYYNAFIGSPANIKAKGIGMALAAWGADFPSGYGYYKAIADGRNIPALGNTDYPSLNDPKVNSMLDAFEKTSNASTQAKLAFSIDKQVMADAVYLPYQFDKTFYIRSKRLTNVYLQAGLGGFYDTVNIGIK
jgi:peptide/nickel transport system substrate-binding protein